MRAASIFAVGTVMIVGRPTHLRHWLRPWIHTQNRWFLSAISACYQRKAALWKTPSTRPAGQPERNEFEFLLRSHYSCAPAMLARHSSWQPLMPWSDGRIDWFYNLHLARQGNFVYVDRVVAHYRTHEQGHHTMSLREGLAEQHFELILREFSPMATKTMRRVTGHTYLHIALSYFGLDRELDARRCFKIAMRNAPLELFNRRCIGPLLACFVIGSKRYNAIKLRLKVLWK